MYLIVCLHEHVFARVWKSKDNLRSLALSSSHTNHRDQTNVVRLSSNCLYPVNHLTGSCFSILKQKHILFFSGRVVVNFPAMPPHPRHLASVCLQVSLLGTAAYCWGRDMLMAMGSPVDFKTPVWKIGFLLKSPYCSDECISYVIPENTFLLWASGWKQICQAHGCCRILWSCCSQSLPVLGIFIFCSTLELSSAQHCEAIPSTPAAH